MAVKNKFEVLGLKWTNNGFKVDKKAAIKRIPLVQRKAMQKRMTEVFFKPWKKGEK